MTPTRVDDGGTMERRVGNLEVQVATILTTLKTHAEWVGESREFHKEMEKFKTDLLARQDAIREEGNRKHRSNSLKLSIIMACIAFGTLLIAVATFVTVNWVSKHAEVTPGKILHSQADQPEQAQLAIDPY